MDSDFKTAIVQFSFTNTKLVPVAIPSRDREIPVDSIARRKVKDGKVLVEATNNCSVEYLSPQLKSGGYTLVDAYHQVRLDRRNHKRVFQMVRFVFARREKAFLSPLIVEKEALVQKALDLLLSNAFWRVRVYANLQDEGSTSLSINLENRVNRFQPDGKPVLARRKDENGKPIGEPVPLTADFELLMWEPLRLEKLNIGTEVG